MSDRSNDPRRYKPGLAIPPHKVQQLWRAFARIPWLVAGAALGALFVGSWPGQTKGAGLAEIGIWVGGGLLVGLVADWLAHRRRRRQRVSE